MPIFTDQTGRTVEISESPSRIVSLVPSQTELLFDLGLGERVVGITKFCVHPEEWFRTKTRVGGTKQLKAEVIRSLKPDLVIANKEENEQAQVEQIIGEFPVWISDIKTLADAKKMILSVGEMTRHFSQAVGLLNKIDRGFDQLKQQFSAVQKLKAVYLIWNSPMMTAGGDTFISSMLHECGFANGFLKMTRYPEITDEMIANVRPDIIFLSSEPFPFKEKHKEEFSNRFPGVKIVCVDGEMFSWYGSRLQHAPGYFQKLFEQIETLN